MKEALDLEAIRERCEKATPGPWCETASIFDDDQERLFWQAPDAGGRWIGSALFTRDCDFIAHARSDIPALLDALVEARNDAIMLAAYLEGATVTEAAVRLAVPRILKAARAEFDKLLSASPSPREGPE